MKPADSDAAPRFQPEETGQAGVHRFSHAAMASVFEIFCAYPDGFYAEQAANAAFDMVDQLEGELSCHRASSDITRINHLPAGENLQVGCHTMECLVLSLCLYAETAGVFDISLGSGLPAMELFPDDFRVRAGADGVRLNLGGIGKGYAVDRAAEVLEEWGIRQALIHAGFSSVMAQDPPAGKEGWSLTLSRPGQLQEAVFARLNACREALSCSGIRKGDHILDPRTGHPVRNRPGAWVAGSLQVLASIGRELQVALGKSGSSSTAFVDSPSAVAEAFSTAFMILSPAEIAECCRRHPGLQAWVLEQDLADPAAPAQLTHLPTASGR